MMREVVVDVDWLLAVSFVEPIFETGPETYFSKLAAGWLVGGELLKRQCCCDGDLMATDNYISLILYRHYAQWKR